MLHIETGHPITKNVQRLDAKGVRFIAEDGRTMFEVHAGSDGASIEVRGVEVTLVKDVLYDSKLAACPNASNSLTIRACRYGD